MDPPAQPQRAPLFVALAVALTRLPFLPSLEQDPDGARFVRAVLRFDLAQGHPHPPGYPLYIALGRVASLLGLGAARSLALVSALSAGVLAAVTLVLARRAIGDPRARALAAAFTALGTVSTVLSARPLSDMTGAALAWTAVAWATRARPSLLPTGILVGLLVATRPSALPLALPALAWALWHAKDLRALVKTSLAAALTALALYLPVVLVTGPSRYLALVLGHATGHFTRFGGSVVTKPDLGERLSATAFGLWCHVLGGGWTDRSNSLIVWSVAAVALLFAGLRSLTGERARALAPVWASAAAYGLWAVLGQNVLWQPRHLLPLAPCVALALGLGLERLTARWRHAPVVALVALLPLAAESLRLLWVQSRTPPPAVTLARVIEARVPREGSLVATSQLGNWLRGRASRHRVVEVTDAREALALGRRAGLSVWLTSEVPGAEAVTTETVVRVRGDRYVTTALYDLALRRVSAPTAGRR